jgi:hypothetical protein
VTLGNDIVLLTLLLETASPAGSPGYRGMSKDGRGTKKVPLVGMVQRDGDVRFRMVEPLTVERLSEVLVENRRLHMPRDHRRLHDVSPARNDVPVRA